MIPYGRQHISEADIQAVVAVLKSDFLTQGPAVPAFEQAVCDYTGARYGVAVNSGTSALHLACLALGLGEGDWLWTSPITFVASANCGLYCGAQVDFVDIDPATGNLSARQLAIKLQRARQANCLPKIVVAVHLSGLSCDMAALLELSHVYGFHLIEDACHALGGRYRNQPIGSCYYADITVLSFHPVKTMTCGEGGMALTNDSAYASKMARLRSHGITRDPTLMTQPPDGPWYYQQIELGFNYRMTDIQAALGLSQLQRLTAMVARRHAIAHQYDALLSDLPLQLPYRASDQYSGLHLYVIRLQGDALLKNHTQIFAFMREQGIGVNLHYIPVHLQPYYQRMGFGHGDFPHAEAYYQAAITIPLFPDLSDRDIHTVVRVIRESLQ